MKALSADSILARLLGKLTVAVFRHPRWFVYPQVVLFVVCVLYTIGCLKADMNQDNLVGPNQRYHRNYLELQKEFPQQGNDLVVAVESDSPEKNRQFVERLAMKMAPETNLFCDVFYQHDLAMMGTKALFFVPQEDLAAIQTTLHADQPFIRQFTQTTNLVLFFNQINTAFRTAPRETNAQTESLVQTLPVLTRILTQADASLQMSGKPPSPGVAALFGANDISDIYITFNHGRIFLLTTHPPNDDLNGEAIERLRVLIRQTQEEVPGVNVGLTGEPVLDYDQMRQSQRDVTLASIVSLVLCALIFIYGYNETGRPIKATFCLVIGLAYTLGFTTLTVGHLNILTITFVPMLIGLAIDFGVHLITRYEEELRHGKTEEAAMTKAMVFTGQGIFTGALTTAGAFLAMAFTHFRGIQEMGVICGGGLLLCLVPMMTMLPALLLQGRQNVIDHSTTEDETRARIENFWLQRPVWVVAATVGLCLLAWFEARKVQFDYNLIQMQSPNLASVVFEHKLINSADKSLLYGAIVATNLEQAIALEGIIQKLPTVADIEPPVEMLSDFLGSNQEGKLGLIRGIKQEVAPLKFNVPDLKPVNVNELSQTLYSLYGYAGAALDEVRGGDPELAKQFVALRQAIENLRKTMLAGDSAAIQEHATKLAEFQQALFNDVRETFESLKTQNDTAPLQVDDLPSALRDQFVGVTGKFLLQVYPKHDVWQRENQEKFVADLRTVDENATGTPVQLYEYETLLKNSYVQAAWYSLAAIVVLVFFHFRSLGAVILALLPVGIGSFWLTGLMGWFGVSFNLANIMTMPLLIGIGVTNGIHVLNRFAEERTPSILARSTGKAVLVSGLTAIAGFGSLILAKHYGMYSLGCVMATGITTCMIAGLTFLPALINLLGRWRPLIETNQPSADNSSLPTLGQEEPRSKPQVVGKRKANQ
ncbi:MAG TPA: MMPL family transporter [Candidatus Sulfopaludibacter sp.]|nr:MMPL family transporter [Candidatus Sulfopaludibacter sp.]